MNLPELTTDMRGRREILEGDLRDLQSELVNNAARMTAHELERNLHDQASAAAAIRELDHWLRRLPNYQTKPESARLRAPLPVGGSPWTVFNERPDIADLHRRLDRLIQDGLLEGDHEALFNVLEDLADNYQIENPAQAERASEVLRILATLAGAWATGRPG